MFYIYMDVQLIDNSDGIYFSGRKTIELTDTEGRECTLFACTNYLRDYVRECEDRHKHNGNFHHSTGEMWIDYREPSL